MTTSSHDLRFDEDGRLVLDVDSSGRVRIPAELSRVPEQIESHERRLNEIDHDALRVASVDAGASATAQGHRELVALVLKNHAEQDRKLVRLQALLLGLVAEAGLRVNDVSSSTTAIVALAVMAIAFGSPELASGAVATLAKIRGVAPSTKKTEAGK